MANQQEYWAIPIYTAGPNEYSPQTAPAGLPISPSYAPRLTPSIDSSLLLPTTQELSPTNSTGLSAGIPYDAAMSRSASVASTTVHTPEVPYAQLVSPSMQQAGLLAPGHMGAFPMQQTASSGWVSGFSVPDWNAVNDFNNQNMYNTGNMVDYNKPASAAHSPFGSTYEACFYPDVSGMQYATAQAPRGSISMMPATMPPSPMTAVYPASTTFVPMSMSGSAPTPGYQPMSGPISRRPSAMMMAPSSPEDATTTTKQTCTQCNKKFKDLKAHKLTHQEERPEKCPIPSCEYNSKGFARRYDRNRHTLTHYKGTMICGFCPGGGSTYEKTFNRADVFKRHLTSHHGVEQTPPNSRRRNSGSIPDGSTEGPVGYGSEATGQCSTCPRRFRTAQDFYEHLDECVMRIVQQEDPAEAINAKCLESVATDKDVVDTLVRNKVPLPAEMIENVVEEDDYYSEEEGSDEEIDPTLLDGLKSRTSIASVKKARNPAGVTKAVSTGLTHSRHGLGIPTKKTRKPRREYPASWGYDKGQMKLRKRVVACFTGTKRLVKDDMMVNNDHEVRVPIGDNHYVTDLDMLTLKRAEGWLTANQEHLDSYIGDDPSAESRAEYAKQEM